MSETEDRNGVQSVEVAGLILAVMAEVGTPLQLKDIASRAGLSPGKVHRYLVSLAHCDLVRQDADTGRYGIGGAAITLGLSGLRSMNVVNVAAATLPSVRDQLNETAILAIWTSSGPVIVNLEESSRQIFMNVRVGSILPLLHSAVGRVFAAHLPQPEVSALLDAPGAGGHNPTLAETRAILAATRHAGIGSVVGDLVPGVSALAAPIFDHRGQIVAAVGVLGRSEELDVGPASPAAATLRAVALGISGRLGHTPKPHIQARLPE